MKRSKNFKALGRAVSVMAAVSIVVSGVTFAALQSQQIKLTGNSIETATANLQLSTDGTTYGTTHAGFDFSNLVPGGPAVPGNNGFPFFLKNTGGVPLALKFSVTSTLSNPSAVDLTKVNVILTPTIGSPQTFTLAALLGNGGVAVTLPSALLPGTSEQFTLLVSMASDAVSGSGASLGNIDFAFSGLAQSE